jgi:prepilin-type N-terminal cleavage/methylation domain-containing protein
MPHPNFPRRQSGFTLIEIAIVLVIIGLLLGGILKGQELITQGRIRNVGNDFQSVTAAINLYQDRYRALPGDDAGAKDRWASTDKAMAMVFLMMHTIQLVPPHPRLRPVCSGTICG